jgi:RNA polymerase sigma-70 factor (ECF subfamily)
MTTDSRLSSDDSANETSSHVRHARAGDSKSIAWLVSRFAPALLAQANYRLRRLPRGIYDPEDLVQDAWIAALPRLPDLPARDERYTPVLMRFLSTALLNRSNTLLQKHLKGKPLKESVSAVLSKLVDHTTQAVSRTLRSEAGEALRVALAELTPQDREIVVLRGIEQNRNETVAKLLELKPNTVAVRYRRALARLRKRLKGTVFDELD